MDLGPPGAMTVGSSDGWAMLVERDGEREVIDAALAGSRQAHGRFVLLYGQGGIGRSSLLRASMVDADVHGIGVLDACGSELERGYGFGVVRQLLEARIAGMTSDERQAMLSHAGPAAESALGIGPSEARVSGAGFDQIEAVQRLIGRLAADAPLLVAVDDLQWCDRPSLDFLCFLGHRARQLPVTIIAAWRRGEPGVRAGRLQALAGMPETFFLTPAPLSHDGVRVVLRRETGSGPSDEAVDVVHAQTGGQPFLVTELVAGLRLRGVPVDAGCRDVIETVTPESVRRTIVARLGRHPETVQRFARAVAVLGDGSVTHAAALAGVDREGARRATDTLVRAGVFRDDSTVAYAQPILQRAVYDTLSSLERAELHQQAAALLCDTASGLDAGDVERAARHLLNCEPAGEPRFADVLRGAALRAVEQGALADARLFYERALGEAEELAARAEILIRLADVEVRSRDFSAGVTHASEALTLVSSSSERAEASLVCAEALAAGSGWAAAVELLEGSADTLADDDADRAFDLRASAATLRACAGAPLPRGTDGRDALERLPGDTVAERKMLASTATELTLEGATSADTVAELCRRALSRDAASGSGLFVDCAEYLACRAAVLADAGDLVETVLAARASAPPDAAPLLGLRSQLALSRGELADADDAALAGLDSLEGLAPSPLCDRIRRDLLAALVLVRIERGRVEEAREWLQRLTGSDDEAAGPELILLRLALGLAHGAPAVDAANEAERAVEGIVAPAGCLRAWAALTHHVAGDDSRALALAKENLERARAWGGPSVLGNALLIRGIVGAARERLRFMEEAVAVLERSSACLELARATVELGAALRRAGRRRDSRAQLMNGADLAQRCGADALASRARAELVSAGARPRRAVFTGVNSLTVAERRVAMLAATGMTKREIANELTVSVKTVSGQLGAVYLKLDVHDRAALAAALGEAGQVNVGRARVH